MIRRLYGTILTIKVENTVVGLEIPTENGRRRSSITAVTTSKCAVADTDCTVSAATGATVVANLPCTTDVRDPIKRDTVRSTFGSSGGGGGDSFGANGGLRQVRCGAKCRIQLGHLFLVENFYIARLRLGRRASGSRATGRRAEDYLRDETFDETARPY